MTIDTNLGRVQYTSNGVTTDYTFASRILEDTHLTVLSGTDVLVLETDYTVLNVGQSQSTVQFLPGRIPANGTRITILRSVPLTQLADYVENDPFPAETHENALDKLTMIEQQQDEQINRAFKYSSSAPTNLTPVFDEDPVANSVIVIKDAFGKMGNGPDVSDIENAVDAATDAIAARDAAIAARDVSQNWAVKMDGPVDGSDYSSKYNANQAAIYAAQAAASASQGLYRNVVNIDHTDSPFTPLLLDEGNLFKADTSGGPVSIVLDELSNYGEDMKFAFVKEGANDLTITVSGTDTLVGGGAIANTVTVTTDFLIHDVIGSESNGQWFDKINTISPSASAVGFNNATSGLTATNVQDAIDELFDMSKLSLLHVVIDDGGIPITQGVKTDISIPFDCTIVLARAIADQSGSIVVDIWKNVYANYPPTNTDSITAAAPIMISSSTKSEDSALTGWDTSLEAGSTLRFNVDSNPATNITRCVIELFVEKTP